jgi:hypothetical protein
MKLKERTNAGLAAHLGISRQALSNKLSRDTYSSTDLIRIAEYLDVELMFAVDSRKKYTLDKSDIKEKNKEEN